MNASKKVGAGLFCCLLPMLVMGLKIDKVLAEERTGRFFASLNEEGLPVIAFQLAGKLESFIIDTGSDIALHLNDEARTRLKHELVPAGTVRTIDAGGKVNKLRSYRIDSLSVNGMAFTKLRAVDLKPWGTQVAGKKSLSKKSEMVIGRPFFAGKAILLDFRSGFIEIMPSESGRQQATAYALSRLALNNSNEGLIAEAERAGKRLHLILDTASSFSLIKKSSIGEVHRIPCKQTNEDLGFADCARVFVVNDGGSEINPVDAFVIDSNLGGLEADGMIGADFLLSHPAIIDFATPQMFIESKRK